MENTQRSLPAAGHLLLPGPAHHSEARASESQPPSICWDLSPTAEPGKNSSHTWSKGETLLPGTSLSTLVSCEGFRELLPDQPGLHSDNYEAIRIIAKLLTFGGGNSHWLPELTSNLKSSNGTELTGRFLPSQVGWFCFGFGFRGSSPLNGLVVTLF